MARLVGACLVAVLVFFGGYEVVERLWLREIDPRTVYVLHLLRGLSAAVIAATVVVIAFMRAGSAMPPRRDTRKRWRSFRTLLQRVSLRTKIIVPVVGLAVGPVVLAGVFAIAHTRNVLRASATERIEFDTASKADSISNYFESVRQDTLFLSQLTTIRDLAGAEGESFERLKQRRDDAQQDLMAFTRGKRAFYQVRYLDSEGREVVRLNVADGIPQIVPVDQLQDKGDRPYVSSTLALDPGVVFVSEMEPNYEHGRIEVPLRAVVRCATRVTDSDAHPRGIVVINIFANFISALAGPFAPNTDAWLVTADGTYLAHLGESGDQRKAFRLDTQRSIADDENGEVTDLFTGLDDDLHTAWTDDTLVTRAEIRLPDDGLDRHWNLLVEHARGPVQAPIRYMTAILATATMIFAAVAGVIGVFVAHYVTQPLARLRHATREIAAGDLSKRLEIHTGDEIEALADDFNTMTSRLRAAQDHLARWNVRLEDELAKQSERLHRLQAGLARTDKLASLGQMAAGVMHEIGNPLAAIKTRIQVAEEDRSWNDQDCALLGDILKEVDRLAGFLRPFSRLSRLGEAKLRPTSIVEVVRSVVDLIAPELERRKLALRIDLPERVPLVDADADQIRQLLINLLLNAADASSEGGEIKVRVRCEEQPLAYDAPGGTVILDIIDRGAGMPPNAREKIGTPFFTTKPDGTGLGLAIVRRIVESHEGELDIQSELGEGTIVTVRLSGRPTGDEYTERTGGC